MHAQTQPRFYEKRIVLLLQLHEHAITSKEVWKLFKKIYANELSHMKGKTKKRTVDAALSKLSRKAFSNVFRMRVGNTFMYTAKTRHDMTAILTLSCLSGSQ